MSETYKNEGYILETLELTSFSGEIVDLSGLIHGMVIKQSLFENVMHGSLTVLDGLGVSIFLPIVGEETLRVKFQAMPGMDPFEATFRVYGMYDYNHIRALQGAQYRLDFISEEYFKSQQAQVNRTYKEVLASDIANDLYSSFIARDSAPKPFDVDLTVNNIYLSISNRTPIQAMNMLTTYSQGADSAGSLFHFYETNQGFHFRNLETLYAQDPAEKYTVSLSNLPAEANKQDDPEVVTDDQKPNVVAHLKTFDHLEALRGGMFGNRVDSIDLITKTYRTNTFNYNDQFNTLRHVEPSGYKFTSPDFQTESRTYRLVNSRTHRADSTYFSQYDGDVSTYSKEYETLLPLRIAMHQQMNYVLIVADIPGNTQLKAGDIIELILDTRGPDDGSVTHKYLSGRFLIRDVDHILKGDKFNTKLMLSKDCLASTIERT